MRALLVVVALSAVARAEMPPRVSVAGDGTCPTAPSVARALAELHPRLATDGGVRVEIVDRGATYEVRADGRTRTLADPARRCGERATAAALAATLMLDPPSPPPTTDEPAGPLAPRETPSTTTATSQTTTTRSTATPAAATPAAATPAATTPAATTPTATTSTAPAPAPTTPAPAAPPPASAPSAPRRAAAAVVRARAPASSSSRPSRVDLELLGLVDGAPSLPGSAAEVTGGASLRLAVGGRYVAGTLGFTGLAPATATSRAIAVDVVRIPFDAGVRLILPAGRVEPAVDVGLALTVLQLSAPSLDASTTETRLDVGLRIAPVLRILLTSRLALVLGMQMIVSFAPYDLFVNGQGTIATTPRLWLGGGAGLAARF